MCEVHVSIKTKFCVCLDLDIGREIQQMQKLVHLISIVLQS